MTRAVPSTGSEPQVDQFEKPIDSYWMWWKSSWPTTRRRHSSRLGAVVARGHVDPVGRRVAGVAAADRGAVEHQRLARRRRRSPACRSPGRRTRCAARWGCRATPRSLFESAVGQALGLDLGELGRGERRHPVVRGVGHACSCSSRCSRRRRGQRPRSRPGAAHAPRATSRIVEGRRMVFAPVAGLAGRRA